MSQRNNYARFIQELSAKVPSELLDLTKTRKRPRAPTQAFSEFLINREQGDWAERLISESLAKMRSDVIPVKYGRTDEIVAGEPSFESFFEKYQDELDEIGKRPDLLLFEADQYHTEWGRDVSRLERESLDDIAPNALVGLEIRSSAYLMEKYYQSLKTDPPKGERHFLSFTCKVEDLYIVIKWIETYNVPHFYLQVLFDRAYVLPFHRILELIADESREGTSYTIEKNSKNQFKTTIHVNLEEGSLLGKVTELPNYQGMRKEVTRGRLIHYVTFAGGEIELEDEAISDMVKLSRELKGSL